MRRVLVIGSGKRVQRNFLPALHCLRNHFEVHGIHSKTPANCEKVAAKFGLTSILDPYTATLHKVSTVLISVPPSMLPIILKKIALIKTDLEIVVDTPLDSSAKGLQKTLKLFKTVRVAEDFVSFTQFNFIRNLINKGCIGELRKIEMNHYGFRYHGISLLRSFFDFMIPTSLKVITDADGNSTFNFDFKGVSVMTNEPYDYDKGSLRLTGDKGVLSIGTGSIDANITPLVDQQGIYGYEYGTETCLLPYRDELLKFDSKESFIIEKTHGLIDVLLSLVENNIQSRYTYHDGVLDQFLSERCRFNINLVMDVGRAEILNDKFWFKLRLKRNLSKLRSKLP